MIRIEKATQNDVDIIQEFGSKLLNYERDFDQDLAKDWALSEVARQKYLRAIDEHIVLLAKDNDKAVGFLVGAVFPANPNDARPMAQATLQNIYVDETARNAKVGERLFNEFKRIAMDNGAKRLTTTVLASNEIAQAFYQKIGFSPRAVILSQNLEK